MTNARISNSLSYFLEQALIIEKNSLETVSKVSDAVTSQKDTVTITLTDPSDSSKTTTYSIPSFGYLKSEIERLDNTLKTLTNIDSGTGSRVQLSDGTYRKIVANKLACEAPTITTIKNITNFNFKSNWLFEDMMNPYLYANVDLTNCVPTETERVLIQRYILNCTSAKHINYFDNLKSNTTNIDYKNFLQGLLNNGITYVLDENYYDLPPVKRRYSGEFEIDRILDNTMSSDGKNILIRIVLKSLSYTDNNSGVENTVTLSKNDILEIKENPATTRYMVTYVDTATKEIKLKRIEGYTPITNSTVFKISSHQVKKINVEIPVSFNKREVIFVKAIDPDSNIPSNKWSPGIAFYTNELKYTNPQGVTNRLDTFYQQNVVDFGNIILSYSKDYYPSIVEGIKPNAPILRYDAEDMSGSDFKIVRINTQLEEGTDTNTIKNLIANKENALSQINSTNKLIEQQKEYIQTTKFTTTTEKTNAQNKLSELIKNQSTYTSLYTSIVNQIKSQYASTYIESPKYRVRGFWSIPSPQISSSSGPQQIIQFKVRYRYLSESGIANKEEEFNYLDGGVTATGRFSNWNEVLTPMRRRVLGADGTYNWEKVNTADPDQVNINQLDLPIQNGEQIEIQIKSISEAGFPSNPMESDWSNSIIVAFNDFPELQGDDITEIIAQNRVDAAVANIVDSAIGNSNAHMSSSFYTNDKYFAHNAESITSGFLSPEQTPITLYDKLYDLQNQITAILEKIEKVNASAIVKLIDGENNSKIRTLTEGGTTYIFAGNYEDDKNKLDADRRKGAIITKVFYIDISSDTQSGLELLSKIPGDRLSMCPNSISEVSNIIADETQNPITRNDYKKYDNVISPSTIANDYYKSKGRYDLVPINLSASNIINFQTCSPSMYQSAQCKGQFIYSRFRNVSDTFDMYANMEDSDKNSFFDPKADFIKSENTYNFKYNNGINDGDNFWIERLNFYRPSLSSGNTVGDRTSITNAEKVELFDYIVKLYDNLTGSSLSPFLFFSEEDMVLWMWKKYGKTASHYAARNIITNKNIEKGINEKGEDDYRNTGMEIVGLYYKDANGDFDIYTEQKKNYTNYAGYGPYDTENGDKTPVLKWDWEDTHAKPTSDSKGTDTFELDKDFYYTYTENKKTITVYGAIKMMNSYDVIKKIEVVLNRLPKTFQKAPTAMATMYTDKKIDVRLENLLDGSPSYIKQYTNDLPSFGPLKRNAVQKTVVAAEKLAARTSYNVMVNNSSKLYIIEPKIQAAYGFADLGKIKNLNIDGYLSMDDGSYVTTHKIGYEDCDRYRTGKASCDSFLFLSPTTHSEIQVDGDTSKSLAKIKSNASLKVPIIYQYRMEDYNEHIFGNKKLKSSDPLVRNARYANIIGIDIWLNTLSDTPQQYDIVVYSTYDKDASMTYNSILGD